MTYWKYLKIEEKAKTYLECFGLTNIWYKHNMEQYSTIKQELTFKTCNKLDEPQGIMMCET